MMSKFNSNLQPLRIGIMLNGFEVKAWKYSLLKNLLSKKYLDVCCLIINKSKSRPSKWGMLLFLIFLYIDRKIFSSKHDPFESKNIKDLFIDDIDIINIIPKEGKHTDRIKKEDLEKIKDKRLDVVVRLGFRILKGNILKTAKYGVWSLHHGNNEVNRGSTPGFWELINKQPVIGSILQILNNDLDNGKIIYRSFSSVHKLSLYKSLSSTYWKSIFFFERKLKELYTTGQVSTSEQVHKLNFYSHKLYKTPSNFLMFYLLPKHYFFVCIQLLKKLFFKEQWGLYYFFGNNLGKSLWRFNAVFPKKDRMWADPFIVNHNNRSYVFIEELEYKNNKGYISFFELIKGQKKIQPIKIIEEDYHLSFPFTFKHESKYYMIPESRENKTIDLYECDSFPTKWTKKKTLIHNVDAVDTIVFYHNNVWYMFTTIALLPEVSTKEETFLFYSDTLASSSWTPHPKNPIISDVRNARSAGRILHLDDKTFRLSQDCSYNYGYGVNFNEIIKLSKTEYEEIKVDSIEPHWDRKIHGIHSLAYNSGLTIVDGARKIPRFF